MNVLQDLPKPFFVLAPMDDVTDTVFRQIVAGCAAPDLFFTEFVNVDGLQSPGRDKLMKKLRFTPSERPLIAQIWGKHPDNFYKTAREIADGTFARQLGLPEDMNFAGIDLNMGCPEKTVVKNGTCSALINDRPLASEIIKAVKAGAASNAASTAADNVSAGVYDGGESGAGDTAQAGTAYTSGKNGLPVSVKTRLGFNEIDLSWHEFLLAHNLDMLTIHGRTRKEMSEVPAHWDAIGQVRELRDQVAPGTLIVGNGDVMSRQQGMELALQHGLDGVMVGRGIFNDPYLFAAETSWPEVGPLARLHLYEKQVRLFAETWQAHERPVRTLNRFCKVYVNGFDGARELRDQLMAANTTDELLGLLSRAERRIVSVGKEVNILQP